MLIGYRIILIAAVLTVFLGSLMVVSAEMGNGAGDTQYLTKMIIRQGAYALAGLIVYALFLWIPVYRFRTYLFWAAYLAILVCLIACRFFGQTNGAYAWIRFGPMFTIQPSEFAKVLMIALAGKLLSVDRGEKNLDCFKTYAWAAMIYFGIILFVQHDLGSAVVLFVICYCVMLIPGHKQLRKPQAIMLIGVLIAVAGIAVMMSPPFTAFLKKYADDYRVARFLAAADPFLYQYDNGYHLIMSLVSFANGGLYGLGYGNSIHKYMNFPNPSNDFILPVIVEETGILGFITFLILYGCLLIPIVNASFKTERLSSKIVLLGVFTYFTVHFILNIGGVSGLIPLTGVPLLMVSSGGSSLLASLIALALAQNEMKRSFRK